MKKENTDADEQVDFCNVYTDGHKMDESYFHSLYSVTENWISEQRNSTGIVPSERFYHHTYYTSLVTDYNLVCEKEILIGSTHFFYLSGVLTGR